MSGPLVSKLHFSDFTLECRKGEYDNYFIFVNHKHQAAKGLRLYKSSMMKLIEVFPDALQQSKLMEKAGLEDGTTKDIAVINKVNNTEVILYVRMYHGLAYIYLRLFVLQEDGTKQACSYGCRFNPQDNIEKMFDFIIENKNKE